MTRYNRPSKKDLNQDDIIEALEKEGAEVVSIHSLKNAFDIIVYHEGRTFSVEVKNGKKAKLSEGEIKCKTKIEKAKVKYWIITSVDEALEMIKQ